MFSRAPHDWIAPMTTDTSEKGLEALIVAQMTGIIDVLRHGLKHGPHDVAPCIIDGELDHDI
jgi:hypothetical protein